MPEIISKPTLPNAFYIELKKQQNEKILFDINDVTRIEKDTECWIVYANSGDVLIINKDELLFMRTMPQ